MELSSSPRSSPDPDVSPQVTREGGREPAAGHAQVRPDWAGRDAPRLGRYRLGPLLGHGGMGDVHEAWDTLLSRRVALKSLTFPHAAGILRFLREAQLQARVTHPSVCRIYDVDASGEVPFIAMQLVEGPNLLQAAPDLTVTEAVEIMHAVALAINAAHRLNLIHRDIKPSNILLEQDGLGGWNTYVADFGLAKDLQAEGPTQTRVPMGTPEYMPPEQQRGDPEAQGPAVDVYALGATLKVVLELGRGRTDSGRSLADLGWEMQAGAFWRALPRKLRAIMGKCLEERPQDRYRSAGELAEDLRRYLDGEPLLARRGTWVRKLRRVIRRRPVLFASMGLLLLAGAGAGAWSSRVTARRQAQSAMTQRFALDAKEVESLLRIERLIPVHDLRPALALALRRLQRIPADLAVLGPAAQGPGHLAMGRGYLALGDLDHALAALEAAWRGGFTTPDVAYLLCKVHCGYCAALGGGDGLPGAEPEPALAAHLAAARYFFGRAPGEALEPLELGQASLLVQEGAYAAALAKARGVFREAPWRYEAKIEEARALEGQGFERLERGERQAALSLFRDAGLACGVAQGIGQSDPVCYLVDSDWRLHWLRAAGPAQGPVLVQWEEAERLANAALAIDPTGPATVAAKAAVMVGRAEAQLAAGADPEPELRRAERFLAPWTRSAGQDPQLALRRRQIQALRERVRHPRAATPAF